jgi:hypothetical protein
MTVDISTGKGMCGMDMFGSIDDEMYMKLGSEFLSSLGVMT